MKNCNEYIKKELFVSSIIIYRKKYTITPSFVIKSDKYIHGTNLFNGVCSKNT